MNYIHGWKNMHKNMESRVNWFWLMIIVLIICQAAIDIAKILK